jgi:signal transduction histidine kinase
MRSPKTVARFFESLLKQPGPVIRYLLPFATLLIAICIQATIALFVGKNSDFPYVFFFLFAIFVTAWIGGYVPGALTCLITMVGIPLLATPGFRVKSVDPSRLILLMGVSVLVSLVAQSQRKKRDQLREANDQLDRRVQVRTQELAQAVEALELEIVGHKRTEERLKTQLERLNLLGQITRAIGERQDLRSIFQVVIRSLEDSLPIDFGCVCLYDAHAAEVVVNCVGVRSEALAMDLAMTQQAHIGIDQNALSQCVRGRLVYEKDVSQIDFPFPQRLARSGLRAFVAAPLLFESQVFGILIAARREPDSFSSGECEFLKQLSEHVALASHQSEVYSALQQAYDDLRQTQQTVMQQERLRALGQMASGIAHDINNAISPVALYTEMLLEQEAGLSKRTR